MKNKSITQISIILCMIIMIFGVSTAYFTQGDSEKITDITSSRVSLSYTNRTNLMLII